MRPGSAFGIFFSNENHNRDITGKVKEMEVRLHSQITISLSHEFYKVRSTHAQSVKFG